MESLPSQQHIGPLDKKTRIDKWLSEQYPQFSRAYWTECLKQGLFLLNGAQPQPKTTVKEGDVLEWLWDEPGFPAATTQYLDFRSEPGNLEYLATTEHYAVIDKPVGLVVHPGAGVHSGTLANFLTHDHPSNVQLPNWGLIHRLDKDTSGLMVVALTLEGYHALTQQMLCRDISRIYWAVVFGIVRYSQTIDVPIGRDPSNRLKKKVMPHSERARRACTHVRVLERFAHSTLVECELETGRTHQIRVHLEHLGYPLLGEQLYSRQTAARALFPRQALHARELHFNDPISGERVNFESTLPEDLAQLVVALQEGAAGA